MKRILTVLSALALVLSMSICAAASSAPDWSQDGKGSISIHLELPDGLENRGDLSLYRVGDIHEDDGNYSFVPAGVFAEKWESYDDLFSAELAQALSAYANEQNVECTTLKIDEAGNVRFENLQLGLYLVVQKQAAEGYEPIDPFLIGVPNRQNDSYVYQVDASPKIQLETAPTEPPEPTEPTKPQDPQLPQTGQLNWPIPVLASTGLLLLLVGISLCTGKKREDNEA